jgi:glyoxylase I family protein
MINSVIHHLGIGIANPKAAEPFFDALLVEFLGMIKEECTEAAAGWKGRGSRLYLYPIEAGSPPGALQHIAFTARTRAEVDRFAEWARERSIVIIDGPVECPEYGGDYYAVFFRGPEGLKLELVHLTEADHAAPL